MAKRNGAKSHRQVFNGYRSNACRVPGITCPIINSIQELLARSRDTLFGGERATLAKRAQGIKLLNRAIEKLEDVRTANSDLRDLGMHWRECSEEMLKLSREPKPRKKTRPRR